MNNYCETWTDRYRNVAYEIRRWPREKRETYRKFGFGHYIYLIEGQVPVELHPRVFLPEVVRDRRVWINYYAQDTIPKELDWHCGITYYNYIQNHPGLRIAKVGCDYQHLYDDYDPSLEMVERNAKKTIDSLWTLIPNLKVRCGWDHCWRNESEMVSDGKGIFYYPDCLKNMQEKLPECVNKDQNSMTVPSSIT